MGDPSRFLSRFFNFLKKSTRISMESEYRILEDRILNIASALPDEMDRQFSLDEIMAATNNFQEDLVIGKGGFGRVYKGFFYNGSFVFSVKRLNPESQQGISEFKNEVMLLCQLRHQNLVSLIGFCNDKDEMILVYEYTSNGSLADHLFDTAHKPLSWEHRLKICIGAARGLHYLHNGAKQAVIHRDIKSSNILLDNVWVCKLCDFGLSKLRSHSKSKSLERIDTMVKGTFGYLDPEYVRRSELTEKTDVYSFGVVLFEVLCGRKAFDRKLDMDQQNLTSWASRCIEEGTIYSIIDPNLKGKIAPQCFEIFVDIAYSCTDPEGNTRPDMGEVEVKLERALELQVKADWKKMHLARNCKSLNGEVIFRAFLQEYSNRVDSLGTIEGDSVSDLSSNQHIVLFCFCFFVFFVFLCFKYDFSFL